MILITGIGVMFLIFSWSALVDIQVELKYKNSILREQNEILEKHNKILTSKK